MPKMRLRHAFVAVLLLVAMLAQGTWALAGTTGGISGTLTDTTTGKPVADAKITASSPSQTATTTTDAGGHFGFLALAPDSYTVSADKDGMAPVSVAGVTVFADQTQRLAMTTHPELKTIAKITSRAAGNLVKPGTTQDVYSVNSATQQTLSGIGGGGNLNNAYSAVYTTPGVTSYVGNYGFGQVFYIRGGNYDQSGYEYDGVPVNRAFDNYNANSLSTLGQQELEVYTGSSPSGASSATQVGFINQVIKTGTYPGFGNAIGQLGVPAFNHGLTVEAGGASPNRLFSYYVGLTGIDQVHNFIDNSNGGGIAYDGSSQYGISGFGYDPLVGLNSAFFTNGPWSTCQGLGNSVGKPPAGSSTYWLAPPAAGGGLGLPTCETYLPFQSQLNFMNTDREAVANFHFAIPHKFDSGRDDIQLLYTTFGYHAYFNSDINSGFQGAAGLNAAFNGIADEAGLFGLTYPGGPNGPYANICAEMAFLGNTCVPNGPNPLPFKDGYIFAPGTTFGQSAATAVTIPYLFPSTGANRGFNAAVPTDYAEGVWNNGSIIKAQYQKNIGSNSYVRLFGYTFYSDWLQNGAQAWSALYDTFLTPLYGQAASDYELNTHTRGAELQYANQINPQNLLRFTANYTTASSRRNNNGSGGPNWQQGLGFAATNLTNGTGCFDQTTGAPASCYSGATAGSYGSPVPGPVPGPAAAAGANWLVTVPQLSGGYLNAVTPKFTSLALEDEFRPGEKWDLNLGVRYENYTYDFTNLNNPEYNFWFAQAQHDFCVDPSTGLPMLRPVSPTTAPGSSSPIIGFGPAGCPIAPSGAQGVHPDGKTPGVPALTNIGIASASSSLVSPRVSGTYTMDPDDVLRFSVGRFSQPTPAAFEQYWFGSGKLATTYQFAHFYPLGYNTSVHNNPTQVSTNYDFSFEKHLKNTDVTFKLTPFYRYSQNQSVLVSLGPNFVSAVNIGTQRTSGVEVAIQKGDPTRDGLSGQLSYTYVNAKIKYGSIGNAPSPIQTLNNYIVAYNRMTKTCASISAMQNNPLCSGGQNLTTAQAAALVQEDAPCYDPAVQNPNSPGGAANIGTSCTSNSFINNPYYGDAAHGLLDLNGWYETYPNYPPGDPGFGTQTALSPNQFSGWLAYKHDKLTIAPNFVLSQGNAYGDPTDSLGLDPRHCAANQGTTGVTPAPNRNADFQECSFSPYTSTGYMTVPDPYTGNFDGMGAFRNPWQFNLGALIKYDVSPRVSLTLNMANIVNTCFGGDKPAWAQKYSPNSITCGYIDNSFAFIGTQPGAGFFYGNSNTSTANGTAGHPAYMNYPYAPASGGLPFQAYFQAQIKL